MEKKVGKKKNVTLTIDGQIWEIAKRKLTNISQTTEDMLKVLIDLENANETKIVQEIAQTEEEIKQGHGKLLILRNQLEKVRNETRFNMQEKEEDTAWIQALGMFKRTSNVSSEAKPYVDKAVQVLGVKYDTLVELLENVNYDIMDHLIDSEDYQSWKYIKEHYKEWLE